MGATLDFGGTRVLVTGHSGFSGTWLSHMLKIQNADVLGFSRDDSEFSTLFTPKSISRVFPTAFGNVEAENEFATQVARYKPHLVIHLAAQSLVIEGYKNPFETFATNALGTARVLDSSLLSESLRGVLVITTDKVYAEGPGVKTESSPLSGSDPYSCSKVAAEEAVKAFRAKYSDLGISLSVVRGGNVIGGGDWSKNRLVPDLVRAYSSGKTLVLRFPDATRPWQHILDLVYAYSVISWNMLVNPGRSTNTEYNVGPDLDSSFSVLELVEMFVQYNFPIQHSVTPGHEHESKFLALNSAKIGKELGWVPRLNTRTAVALTSQWYKRILEDNFDPHELTRLQILEYLADGRP